MEETNNISWADVGKKLFSFFKSMKFSIVLLLIILVACVIGSVLPQGSSEAAYAAQFGSVGSRVIFALQLDHIFSSIWFALLSGLLCLNLVLCSVSRFPVLYRQFKGAYTLEKRLSRKDSSFTMELPEGVSPEQIGLKAEKDYFYKAGNRWGLWGSWLCHLGMLLVIMGFALGQMLSKEFVIYGIPGATQELTEAGLIVTIDDFEVRLRDDFTVDQYEARLTVSNGNKSVSGTASVNHPMSAFGYSFYQDSTGWANYVDISHDGDLLRQDLICVGEYTYPDQLPALVFQLNKFYPDLSEEGGELYSVTPLLNNPHSLYSIYYQGKKMTMGLTEMDQMVPVEKFGFTLHDPTQYTLLVIKSDPTAGLVGAASLLMLVGIFLAFYLRPYELWSDGKTLWVKALKAPELLKDQLSAKIENLSHR